MPAVTKDQALQQLASAVEEKLPDDELVEVYDEVFANGSRAAGRAGQAREPLAQQLVARINSGLEIDEIIELWRLIFLEHRDVWYDEEEERIHYTEGAEEIPAD